jgi:nucleotide-binding universal stress UspA family protein
MNVLLATDGKPPAIGAAGLVERAASRAAEITVFGVVPTMPPASDEQADAIREAVDSTELRLRAAGFTVHARTVHGDEVNAILREAARGAYDLVVVGAGNHRWLGRLLLGSISRSVIHAAPQPVLVAQGAPEGHQRVRVLVGADGSEAIQGALETATAFLDPDRTVVDVISVANVFYPPLEGVAPAAYESFPHIAWVDRELIADARRYALEAQRQLEERGFRATADIAIGNPAVRLLDRAAAWDADVVIVGSRTHVGLDHLVLGSVSDKVVAHANGALVGRRPSDPAAPSRGSIHEGALST